MTPFKAYLKANFHKTYWPCVWIFFYITLGLLVLVAIGFAISDFTTAETPSFDLIDVVILIGLIAAGTPTLFFISLLCSAVIAISFLWSRWRRGGRDEVLEVEDGSGG